MSLSARRAWIEISACYNIIVKRKVALRKESVDRNIFWLYVQNLPFWSLSARRAWIEILLVFCGSLAIMSLSARRAWIEITMIFLWNPAKWVALRKESVDRNNRAAPRYNKRYGSLSARRAWIEITKLFNYRRRLSGRSPQGERG